MSLIKIYNTGDKSYTQIEKEFVVRKDTLFQIMEDINSSNLDYPEQDYLIIGERGMGKTMLLTMIKHEILKNKQLKNKIIPILFPEELNSVNDLFDLWKVTAEHLSDISEKYPELVKDINNISIETEVECFNRLKKYLNANDDHIILLIDNIDSLFEKIGEEEAKRLREVLITNKRIRIIGASSQAIESTFRYDKAFYEHFITIKLGGLSYEETVLLLKKLGSIFNNIERIREIIRDEKYRIEALRNLTGGNIRNIVMLFNILLSDEKSDPLQDLMKILEDVTPLNIHKVNRLKKQQRKIVDFLAMKWDGVWLSEISKGVRMKSNLVSAQLKSLDQNQIVISKKTSTRKKIYQIRDRFFNIWYLMRYSRKEDKNKVKWLVNFYKIWCSNDDLVLKGEKLIQKISNKKCSPYTVYIEAVAFLLMENVTISQKIKIYEEAIDFFNSTDKKYISELSKVKNIALKPGGNIQSDISEIEKIVTSPESKFIKRGIYFEKVKKDFALAEKFYRKGMSENKAEAQHRLGHLFYNQGFKKWDNYFENSIKNGSREAVICYSNILLKEDNALKASQILITEWLNGDEEVGLFLGRLYEDELDLPEKAKDIYLELIKKFDNPSASHYLGHIYENVFDDHTNAVKYFKKAIENGEEECKNCLAWNLYQRKVKKEEALTLISTFFEKDQSPEVAHTYSSILLWNNNVVESVEIAGIFMTDKNFIRENLNHVFSFLMELLKKKKFNIVDTFFQKEELDLKNILKPLYFALMYFLKEKYPDEFKRMGNELNETVNELISKIEMNPNGFQNDHTI